ncbi:nucleobase:cation symporter-2 family protein [Pseudonocardia xinjiangensis]|uniref:Purine permease n=1 Tax=Pseudonocardia xinjiangensis TaxID=75289 RepID=A0ABX1RDF1_9PSEU|nr:nucleobase:cation symporter-2 family protein [Pseudonocardia xinjiangensis]NMH77150.1 purine permease [Pseudonocardia xinjiangensis]
MTDAQAIGGKSPVDEVPPAGRLLVLGVQHVLVMYAGCVAVPLIVGSALNLDTRTIGLLVNADLVVAGIITLIQTLGIGKILGVRLPIVTGATFTAVTPMILIGQNFGLVGIYGSMIVSGIFGLLIAVPFSRIIRFFPPVVTGSVITIIGLSLISAAAGLIAGSDSTAPDYGAVPGLALAGGIVLLIVLITRFVRGFIGQIAVLTGLVVGALVAIPMGLTDFSGVATAPWFGVSTPFLFGAPQFPLAGVISMCVVMLVIFAESTADMLAVSETIGEPLTPARIARGLAADGFSGVLGGVLNSFPDTIFAQNVGLVQLTGVRSRFVPAVAGAILLLLGLVPKFGEVVASLPGPVVGGAGLIMFATVTAVGIRTLHKVRFDGTNNLMIVAVSIGIGMLPVVAPSFYEKLPATFGIIVGSSITSCVIVAFLLNLLFNHLPWGRPPGDPSLADVGSAAATRHVVDPRTDG